MAVPMKEVVMSLIGEIAFGVLIFLGGMMLSIHLLSKDCASGKPTVIDGKVYRCVEAPRL